MSRSQDEQAALRLKFRAEVEQVIATKRRAYQTHDAGLITSDVYAADAVITGPDVHLEGQAEFRPVFEKYLAQRSDLRLDLIHCEVADDETLGYALGNLTTYPSGDGPVSRVKMLSVWRKEAAGWRMALEVYFPGVIPRR